MKPADETLFSAANLSVSFGAGSSRVDAVRDVSLSVNGGEAIGIVGESGSGKSTLARVLVGLQMPDRGTVSLRGQTVVEGPTPFPAEARRLVQMVFQDPYSSLNPRLTALDAVSEACQVHRGCSGREARLEGLRMLQSMGIPAHDAMKKPRQLSGGQRQRVSVARALSVSPSVLVADEPTSAIDQSAQAQLLNLFNRLIGSGLSIILISHDLAVIRYLAKRVYVMREGEFVESGDTRQIFSDPRHEYTRSLIASIPGRAKGQLGTLPHAINPTQAGA